MMSMANYTYISSIQMTPLTKEACLMQQICGIMKSILYIGIVEATLTCGVRITFPRPLCYGQLLYVLLYKYNTHTFLLIGITDSSHFNYTEREPCKYMIVMRLCHVTRDIIDYIINPKSAHDATCSVNKHYGGSINKSSTPNGQFYEKAPFLTLR